MRLIGSVVAACVLLSSPAAHAQTAPERTAALSQCLQSASSAADRRTLVTWMFTAMSAHPDIKSYSKLTSGEKTQINKQMASLFQRLMTVDCKKETAAVIRNDGLTALEDGFGALGEVAITELMGHPDVDKSISDMAEQVDGNAFGALALEIVKPAQ